MNRIVRPYLAYVRMTLDEWALFNGATVEEILQTAHWKTETTFTADAPQGEARLAKFSALDTPRRATGKEQKCTTPVMVTPIFTFTIFVDSK